MTANIVSLFYKNADQYPDKLAIIHGYQKITYRTMAHDVRHCAAALRRKGIREGDRVLVFIPMSISLYTVLLGLWHCGATAVFLDAWTCKKRLEQTALMADCQAFIGILKAHILRFFSSEIRKIPIKLSPRIIRLKTKGIAKQQPIQLSENAIALITFTTGSTGIPKAAKRTHGFLLAQHQVLNHHLLPSPDDLDLVTLPIFVLTNLAVGITSFIPRFNPAVPHKVNPKKLCNDINLHGLTSTAGSPIIYDKLADYCNTHSLRLDSLKKIFLGGAPVFPELAKKLLYAFPHADSEIVYGSTEAEPISAVKAVKLVSEKEEAHEKGLLVGKPIQAISVRIIAITAEPLPVLDVKDFNQLCLNPEQIGEICVTGDHVLKEYFRNDKAQQENKIIVGLSVWHRTGDAGYLSKDGNLYLMGRTKQCFTHRDKTWYVFPLEACLTQLPGVKLGTYVEIDNFLILVIEGKKLTLSIHEVTEFCAQKGIPIPDRLVIMRIPKDPRHHSKIDYDRLKVTIKKK